MDVGGQRHVLKSVKVTGSDFDGSFLKSNYPYILVSIPQNLKSGTFSVQYRYKDLDPQSTNYNQTFGPISMGKSYSTVNMSTPPPNNSVNLPVYQYYSGPDSDHYYTTHWGGQIFNPGNYQYEVTVFYVARSTTPGVEPIYSSYHPTNKDHYYHLGATGPAGYLDDGIAFYAFRNQVAGTVPIYHFYNSSAHDHYYHQLSSIPGPGYVSSGIAFYAYPN